MTEMLFAVVPDSNIVGRTQVCNFPAAALKKPVVKFVSARSGRFTAAKTRPDFYRSRHDFHGSSRQIQTLGIPVYYQKYEKVEDIFRGLNDIGKIMHREAAAKYLTDSLKAELNAIENAAKSAKPNRVLALISTDPIYVYGQNTLMTDKIKRAGGENALQEIFKQQSPPLTREYMLQLNPDVIFGLDPEQMNNTFFRLVPGTEKSKCLPAKTGFTSSTTTWLRGQARAW